jgi:hypothetical protein
MFDFSESVAAMIHRVLGLVTAANHREAQV